MQLGLYFVWTEMRQNAKEIRLQPYNASTVTAADWVITPIHSVFKEGIWNDEDER